MKRWFLLSAALLFFSATAHAADGKAIFDSNGCSACHAPQTEVVGPALTKIAAAYSGKRPELISFLDGNTQPIVEPDKFSLMKPNLDKTKALTGEERAALADYILSDGK